MTDGSPLRTARPPLGDVALAGVLALLAVPSALGTLMHIGISVSGDPGRFGVTSLVVALGQILPLAWRRRAPLAATAATSVLFAVHLLTRTGESVGDLALVVALYSLAAHVRLTRRTVLGIAVLAAALLAVTGYALSTSWGGPADLVPFTLIVVAPPVLTGVGLRRERDRRAHEAPPPPSPQPSQEAERPAPAPAVPLAARPFVPLTGREEQVLGLLLQGSSNPEIAAALAIGRETVKTHVSKVLGKYGVTSRAELLSLHLRQGAGREHAGRSSPGR